jgi:hypothetical protein
MFSMMNELRLGVRLYPGDSFVCSSISSSVRIAFVDLYI